MFAIWIFTFMSFIKTLETTIKDENELQCVKEKTAHLFEVFADELGLLTPCSTSDEVGLSLTVF